MFRKHILLSVFIFFFSCLLLSGCGSGSSASDKLSGNNNTALEPPVLSPPGPLVPSADGSKTLGSSPLILDVSHLDQGYLIAIADATGSRYNLQLADPNGITYSYFIASGNQAVIPFTGGEGSYLITAYEKIASNQYAALYFEQIDLKLANIFYPFLYPNQYVDFSNDSQAVQLALSILPENSTDEEILNGIYEYVTSHISYDHEKARTVEAGYLPNIDETLETGIGICFDYAALMTAMLRTRGVPCKLQIGYSSEIKHAWIDVYIKSVGWVDQAISFDGDTWSRMDPTFDATSNDSSTIKEYIGDGNNYIVQFSR